jgi:urease accessory protein
MVTPMVPQINMHINEKTSSLGYLRLMQLVSPSLPIGGFTYSQGLEYAVECGWVHDVSTFDEWISGLLDHGMTYLELPILKRIYIAIQSDNVEDLRYWSHYLLASRESRELRSEEINRAKALNTLLPNLGVKYREEMNDAMETTQLSPFALAAISWGISLHDTALGYAWSWLENQVAAAIKLVPLGQTQGQQVQLMMGTRIPHAIDLGLSLNNDEIGASAPALGIASARHETQYTRLFRS